MTRFLVITSINPPSEGIKQIASLCAGWSIIVVGDKKTPENWHCEGIRYLSIQEQINWPSTYPQLCPFNHYTRKNIGYLIAIQNQAEVIAETDDDSLPHDSFLSEVSQTVVARPVSESGWVNVYRLFSDERIWPRGFPLEEINSSFRAPIKLGDPAEYQCSIQQHLVDGDPDVDSIYRLTRDGATYFTSNSVVLGKGAICPFNSQNTIWWPSAYALLYLPTYVSFRMTDIWRSFVAIVCLQAMDGHIAFRDATVLQVRNQHSLLRDFHDEIPGYLRNTQIVEKLRSLALSSLPEDIGNNMVKCYESLVEIGAVPSQEINLLRAWLTDIKQLDE